VPSLTTDPLIGKHVGNYCIQLLLGAGSMGSVYLAEHLEIGRRVAVKFLAQHNAQMAGRFLREARAVAALEHEHIVEVYDFGELEGRLYYTMELLEGRDLKAILEEQGSLSAVEAAPYLEQICAALEAAHAAGIIHRDLKAANVIVRRRPPLLCKLCDFGIARVEADAERESVERTAPGTVLGTPLYMAPELAAGRAEEVGPASDLYALGVLLFRMLAGRFPFEASAGLALAAMHIYEAPPLLASLAAEVPAGVAAIVDQCLRKRPVERPTSAREVWERYRSALGDAPAAPFPSAYLQPSAPRATPADETVAVPAVVSSVIVPTVSIAAPAGAVAETLPPAPKETGAAPDSRERAHPEEETAALESLLAWMDRKGDFPAITKSVSELGSKAIATGRSSAHDVAEVILRDYGLTQKLLKLVNSAYYDRGGGAIKTVVHAIMMMGFDQVRMAAFSLALFDKIADRKHAAALCDGAIRSLLAGELGQRLAQQVGFRQSEEAYICAMFQNVGRQMIMYCLPDAYAEIEELCRGKGISPDRAAKLVLGVPFDRIGVAIARRWRLSDRLVESLNRIPAGERVARPRTEAETLRTLSGLANELCEAVEQTGAPEHQGERLRGLAARFGALVKLDEKSAIRMLRRASETLEKRYLSLLDLDLRRSAFLGRLGDWTGRGSKLGTADLPAVSAPLAPAPAEAPGPGPGTGGARRPGPARDPASAALERGAPTAEVLQLVLQELSAELRFSSLLLLLLRPDRKALTIRAGLGRLAEKANGKLELPVDEHGEDLFSEAVFQIRDQLVADVFTPEHYPRIPKWYFTALVSPTFALFVLALAGRPVGLIYGGGESVEQLPDARELAIAEQQREVALRALRRGG
jgi:serine/threonine protein kinase/HD-like signal output (HDOD) protein